MERLIVLIFLTIVFTGCELVTKSASELLTDLVDPTNKIEFLLQDIESGSTEYTDNSLINLNINSDEGAIAWCVTEVPTSAANSDCIGGSGDAAGWSLTRPSQYNLTSSEGVKKLYLKIKNEEGELAARVLSSTIYLDATPPLVTLASPSDINTTNVSNYTVVGTCSESNTVDISIGASDFVAPCLGGSWSLTRDLTSLSDGNILVSVQQVDSAGNLSTVVSSSINKDATPAVITPTLPTEGYYINIANSSSVTVSGGCTEDGDIVITGAIADTISCSSGVYSKNYDPSSFPQGALQISLNMTDSNGNPANERQINFNKDTIAPTLTVGSVSDGDYINQDSAVGFIFSGNCSEEGSTVSLSGSANSSIICSSGSYSEEIDLSGLADGGVSFSLSFSDEAGNAAPAISLSLTKDTIPPVVTQTSFSSGAFRNANQVSFGGSCDAASSLEVMGTDNVLFDCTGSTWTYLTETQVTDGAFDYTFRQVDGAGNTSDVVVSWNRDTTAPTVDIVSIESGASEVKSLSVEVSVTSSDLSDVTHVKIANANLTTGDCQSEFVDSFWTSFGSGTESFEHTLNPGEGPKKLCVWAKDISGNISEIVPSSGLIGTNAGTITYLKDQIPEVNLLDVTNNEVGLNFGSTFFAIGDRVKISYGAEDLEGLADNPIALYYSTDNTTWNLITAGVGGTGLGTSVSGTYTSFVAPTSDSFRIKAVAIDNGNNQSVDALSEVLNSGSWSVYAGTSSTGVGGANESTKLQKITYGIGYGQLAVSPTDQDMYYVSNGSGGGLLRLSAATGKSSVFISGGGASLHEGTNLSEGKTVNLGQTILRFDKEGLLYVKSGKAITRVNPLTGETKFLFGNGSDNSEPYSISSVGLLDSSSFDVDENRNIYAFVDCEIPSGQWSANYNNTAKIIKATYESGSDSYTVNDFAGNCVLADPVTGGDLNQPIGNYRYKHLLNLSVNKDASMVGFGRSGENYKIVDGKIYRTLASHTLFFDKTQDVLWGSDRSLLKYTNVSSAANNSAIKTTVIPTGGGACNDSGTDVASACVNIYHGNSYGEVHVAWNGQLYFLDVGPRIRILSSTDNKIYTLAGTSFFYGDGLKKQFIRPTKVASIFYKQSTAPNQAAFPEGLYFVDQFAMVFGHIHPTTGLVNLLAGNQSLLNTGFEGGMSKSTSLGTQATDRNLTSLAFDSNGLPWFVTKDQLRKIETDGTFVNMTPDANIRWSLLTQGDSPRQATATRGLGLTNLTLYKDEGIFVMGNSIESSARTTGAVIQYHDYKNDIVQHLIGGQDLPGGEGLSADTSTPGEIVGLTLASACNNQIGTCATYYDEVLDRLYLSEDNLLRYIDNPRNPGASTLTTLYTSTRRIRKFLFNDSKDRLYYISSDGLLYCKYLGGATAPSHCDDSVLGPFGSDFERLATSNAGNSMTWKSPTELILATALSQVLMYRIPAD